MLYQLLFPLALLGRKIFYHMEISLREIKGIGPKIEEKLNLLRVFKPSDLANFFPSGYVDLDKATSLCSVQDGDFAKAELTILEITKPFTYKGRNILKVKGKDDYNNHIEITWFNLSRLASELEIGTRLSCFGKVKTGKIFKFSHQIFEIVKERKLRKLTGIKTNNRTKGVLKHGVVSNLVKELLEITNYDSVISENDLTKHQLMDLKTAYKNLHFPYSMQAIEIAQNRINIENIVKEMSAFRLINQCLKRAYKYKDISGFVTKAERLLPFRLTQSQSVAVEKIKDSLVNSDRPLNVMLIGDVSSGKTVVAVLASLFALYSSYQVAVMAPTEILAKQHYKTFCDYLSEKGAKIALLTGSMGAKEKQLLYQEIREGRVNIVIGTHALLSESVEFRHLSLVVLDEQHRFGVAQRTSLLSKGIACDLISLSATPIPRSLRMTYFGNVEVLNIERRSDSSNITTQIVHENIKAEIFKTVVNKCMEGEQAYVVAPRIFDVEGIEANSVEKIYKQIKRKYASVINIGYMHGNMKNNEKTKIMEDFRANKIAMLVSTSLIEVGVDVANATQMIITDADRFGLSALHQLRGRVGRAGQKSNCYLVTEHYDSSRLKVLEHETDGMKIAEMDYELRGPGEWLGERQSGKMMDNISPETLKACSEIAQNVDLSKNYQVLLNYALDNGLNRISLN